MMPKKVPAVSCLYSPRGRPAAELIRASFLLFIKRELTAPAVRPSV